MKLKHLLPIFIFFLSSCSIYKQRFDCPAEPGIPCTSVTDLEQMVIETENGPDLFINNLPNQCANGLRKKIWINDYKTQEGCWIPGHYIYLD